jgi:MFS family permease
MADGRPMSLDAASETITREQSRRAMRDAVLAQCVGLPLMFTLSNGGLATLYAERLGARDLMVGILNGGIWAGAVVGLWMPALTERYNKRRVLVTAQLLSIIAALPLLAVPFVAQRFSNDAALAVMTVSLMAFGLAIGAFVSAWFPALMDFVPPEKVGRFFGRLRSTWQVVVLGIYLACAVALGPETPLWRMQVVLVVLIAATSLRTLLVARFPQRPVARATAGAAARVRQVLADRAFRRYLVLHTLATGLAGALTPSMVLYLRLSGFSPRAIMLAVAAGMLAMAVGFRLWGRTADRHGAGRNYRIGFVLLAAGFLMWAPASIAVWGLRAPGMGYAFALSAFAIGGLGFASISIGVTHHGFRLTPRESSTTYLAILPVANQCGLGVGMFLVGATLQAVGAAEVRHWCNAYFAAFMTAAVMSVAMLRLIRWVPGSDDR